MQSEEFFPLVSSQNYKVTLEPISDKMCVCGHDGIKHLSQGNRTCMVADCNCNLYSQYKPKFNSPSDFVEKAMIYFKEQETMLENVRWVFDNLLFFRNYGNDELGWAWGKFVLGYDPFEQFMTPDIYKKIKKYGTHSTIERESRRLREECKKSHKDCNLKTHEKCQHECKYCPFDESLIDNKLIKQYGLYVFFRDNQIKV